MSALEEGLKHCKKEYKILNKLNQLTQRYPKQQEDNSIPKMALISNNQLRKHQLNRLIEECRKLNEIPLQMIPQLTKNYDMLFAGTVKQLTNESILDIKLKVHDEFEDYILSNVPAVHASFRRGLCLMSKNNQYSLLRRGLKKFFDIDLKGSIDKQINTITKMEKVNGENAQISYNADLNSWVVGSKNVTLLCQNEEDLKNYDSQLTKNEHDTRYKFAIKIALVWLNIMKKSTKVEQTKQLLNNHTLIGEYCGNSEHQHLVQYQDTQLIFYALVSHQENDTAIHPIKALQLIQELDLRVVKFINFEMKTQEEVKQQLFQLTEQVFLSKLDQEGEGAVLYLSNTDKCIQLVKLKTLEYRAKRKIREKLKQIINKTQDCETQLKKFTEEINHIVQSVSETLGKTLQVESYEDLAEKCFKQASQIKNDQEYRKYCSDLIESKFVLFLDTIQIKEGNAFENLYIK